MNVGTIKYCDIANGVGVRTSLFVTGCRIGCAGCFNEVAQDFSYGEPYERATEDAIIESLRPNYIQGLSLLGGDPMEPENQRVLVGLVERVVRDLPEKDIWCYTGYLYDKQLQPGGARWFPDVTDRLLDCLDVLVDGPFVEAQKDITLRFRGSANQRLIDMQRTRAQGGVVLWKDEEVFSTHTM